MGLLPLGIMLRLTYIFHEMNASIPGYKLSSDSLGMQSLLISEAWFIFCSRTVNICLNLANLQQVLLMFHVVSAVTPLFQN